jgi:hypothetical protein
MVLAQKKSSIAAMAAIKILDEPAAAINDGSRSRGRRKSR